MGALRADVAAALAGEGCSSDAMRFQAEADMRYVGQAYELTVPVILSDPVAFLAEAERAFHDEHQRTYGHASMEDAVELVNLRVIGLNSDSENRKFSPPSLASSGRPERSRIVYFDSARQRLETPILERAALLQGLRSGPLIVEEYDSTTVVPPGWTASLDRFANIVISREV
jgi:N-methylhydantoinase A